MRLQIGYIQEPEETKTREIDLAIVAEYAERMLAGDRFPAIRCRQEGKRYWLADGRHRLAATRQAGLRDIEAMVEPGTLQDAVWDTSAVNRTHGLKRTQRQTQEAIVRALRHSKAKSLSDGQIASHVGVSRQTITAWREKMARGDMSSPVDLPRLEPASLAESPSKFTKPEEENNLSAQEVNSPATRIVLGKDGKTYKVAPRNKQVPTLDQQLDRVLRQLRLILLAMGPTAPSRLVAVVADTTPEQLPNIGSSTPTVVDGENLAVDPM